jgi:hypothetical protein
MRYRIGSLLLALGLLVTTAPAVAADGWTKGDVPSNGAWVIYNRQYLHNPSPYYSSTMSMYIDDNVRNGMLEIGQ